MKNLLLATMILLGMVTTVTAIEVDDTLKKRCQYYVYGNGHKNDVYDLYMAGIISGQLYQTPTENKSEYARKTKFKQINELACKEALNDNGISNFLAKYLWGVKKIINKNYKEYRTIK